MEQSGKMSQEVIDKCPVCNNEKFNNFLVCKDFLLTGESFPVVKCDNCGFTFTNPRPPANELGRYYKSTDYISHSNSRKGLFNSVYQKVRNYTLKKKFELISEKIPSGSILDIGCATGEFLNTMKDHNWTVTGIEPDEQVRKAANEKYGINIFKENALDSLPAKSYDVITMWHVLEHVPQLNERIEQCKKLLKPGGYIFIAVPNSESYDAVLYKEFWAAYDVPRHLYHFSKQTMKILLENHNLKISEILPMKFDSFYVSILSEKIKGNKLPWIKAVWNGFWSNLKAKGKMNFSSLIFVVENK